jgi:hypothetical protein
MLLLAGTSSAAASTESLLADVVARGADKLVST